MIMPYSGSPTDFQLDPYYQIFGRQPNATPSMGGILGNTGGSGAGMLNGGALTAAQHEALMRAAATLMSASAPSRLPVSFGQAFGQALTAGREGARDIENERYQRLLIESQIAKNLRVKQSGRKYENLLNRTTQDVQRVEVGSDEYDELITSGEWVGTGDVKPAGEDDSVRAAKIADAKANFPFLSNPEVIALVDGYLDVSTVPDAAGLITITNKATQETRRVAPGRSGFAPQAPQAAIDDAQPLGDAAAAAEISPNPSLPYAGAETLQQAQERLVNYARVKSAFDDALVAAQRGATGPASNIKALITKGAALFGSAGFQDNYQNRAALDQFRQTVKAALANNPRVPVAEQEQWDKLIPGSTEFFTNPQNAAKRLSTLAKKIDELERIDRAVLRSEPLPVNEKGRGSVEEPFIFRDAKDLTTHWKQIPSGSFWVDPETGTTYRKK